VIHVVFECVKQTVTEIGVNQRIVIIFMTDGCDSCNSPNALTDGQTKLGIFLKKYASHCVVHAIGYSKDHDLNMMNTLKSLGATEGIYRYAEGSTGLDEKFRELFEFADSTVELTMTLPRSQQSPMKILGEIIDSDYVEAECWLSISEKIEEPIEITVDSQQYRLIPTYTQPDRIFTLKSLSKRVNDVKTQEDLQVIQDELQQVNVFGHSSGLSKADRQAIIEFRSELQARLDALHTIMGDTARGTLNQTAALAKMNDLRYADRYMP
jgi:hypothetical protein